MFEKNGSLSSNVFSIDIGSNTAKSHAIFLYNFNLCLMKFVSC